MDSTRGKTQECQRKFFNVFCKMNAKTKGKYAISKNQNKRRERPEIFPMFDQKNESKSGKMEVKHGYSQTAMRAESCKSFLEKNYFKQGVARKFFRGSLELKIFASDRSEGAEIFDILPLN